MHINVNTVQELFRGSFLKYFHTLYRAHGHFERPTMYTVPITLPTTETALPWSFCNRFSQKRTCPVQPLPTTSRSLVEVKEVASRKTNQAQDSPSRFERALDLNGQISRKVSAKRNGPQKITLLLQMVTASKISRAQRTYRKSKVE